MSALSSSFRGQTYPDIRGEMIYFNVYQNFNVNRNLLTLCGLWPYQKPKVARLQQFFIFSILFSFVIFQLTTFVTTNCTPNLIIKILTNAFVFIGCTVIYNIFWYKITFVKYLLEELQQIANELRNENEVAIIEKYAYKGKRFTILLTLAAVLFILTVQLLWTWALNVLPLVNGSRTFHPVLIMTEYFIDKEKYRYLLLLHMNAAFCTGALTVVATATTYLGYLHHICGMFKIASYRIENAIEVNSQQGFKKEVMIYNDIIYAVDIHCKAMKSITNFLSSFKVLFLIVIITSVISLSLNLYRISQHFVFQILASENDVAELLLNIIYANCFLITMFVINYMGQEITDHNNHVFVTTYNIRWYIAPLHIQKIILLLLQRGTKPFIINIASVLTTSLECFASLTSTSVSYFTVLYSTQQKSNDPSLSFT